MTSKQIRTIFQHVHEFMMEHEIDELVIHQRTVKRRGRTHSRLTITYYNNGRIIEPITDDEPAEASE